MHPSCWSSVADHDRNSTWENQTLIKAWTDQQCLVAYGRIAYGRCRWFQSFFQDSQELTLLQSLYNGTSISPVKFPEENPSETQNRSDSEFRLFVRKLKSAISHDVTILSYYWRVRISISMSCYGKVSWTGADSPTGLSSNLQLFSALFSSWIMARSVCHAGD